MLLIISCQSNFVRLPCKLIKFVLAPIPVDEHTFVLDKFRPQQLCKLQWRFDKREKARQGPPWAQWPSLLLPQNQHCLSAEQWQQCY